MFAAYGIDVLDPSVTLRRVKVLTERLPPGYWPNPDHQSSWDVACYLLAQVIDSIHQNTYATVRVAGGKPSKPKPFYRPGSKNAPRRGKKRTSWAGLAESLVKQTGVEVHRGGK